MKSAIRPLLSLLVCGLILAFRAWQAQESFQKQQEAFSQPPQGVFRAWVAEEPEVLFSPQPGSHDTGRLDGSYQPFVREVRAVCVLIPPKKEKTTLVADPERGSGLPGFGATAANPPPIKVRCAFRLSSKVPQPLLSYGETLEMAGKIQRPSPAMNPGQFDYAHYLKTKGIAYVMYVAPGKWRKVESVDSPASPPFGEEGGLGGKSSFSHAAPLPVFPASGNGGHKQGWTFLRWSYGLKRQAEETIYRFLPYPENALLDGILLGVRSPLPEEMVESFFLTGTIHILAVSGMITAFIAGLMFMVFRTLQLGRKWAAGMTLLGLAFFVFMTGAHPPVCRAGLFSAMALLAVLFERRIHGGTLLVATAVLLAAWNPLALEDLSFQISFLATAGLMVMAPWLMEKLAFLWRPAALLVTASTAAQLAVWCLILYDFNQFSIYSIIANLIIVPLALFSTAGGLTLLAGSLLHPSLGILLGAACEVPLKLLIVLADWVARWPKAEWIVASPPVPWVVLFHVLLLFSFLFFWPGPQPEKPSESWKRRRELFRKGRRIAAASWILFTGGTAAALVVSVLRPAPFRAVFLDVGHGNAVVLRSPQGHVLVVDGGRETHGPDRYNQVVSYLRHVGIQKVEGVIATHPDEDHVGGLVNLVWAYPVAAAYEGWGARADTRVFQTFHEAIHDRGVRLAVLKEGDQIQCLAPAGLEVLHPPKKYRPRLHADNNLSVVSLVSFKGFHLILPGDLEKEGLLELLKNHRPFPKVDWLMAPHHGRPSGEPSLCAEGFHPHYVVLSDWKDYPEARAQYRAAVPDAIVLSTSEEGAIELEVSPDGSGRYRSFRNDQWRTFRIGD